MSIRTTYLSALAAAGLTLFGAVSPVNALTIFVASCNDGPKVEFAQPTLYENGIIFVYRTVIVKDRGANSVYEYSDVYASCASRRMIVVENDGVRPMLEDEIFDRAAASSESYTLSAIAKLMRDEGYDARVKTLSRSSCLCEDGFATEPRY